MNTQFVKFTLIFCMLFSLSFSTFAQTDLEDLDDDGQSQDLNFTGDVQDFIIPDGSYNSIEFVLRGGDGGRARLGDCESEGGDGATIKTSILIGTGSNQFPVGTPIRFIVGEKGTDDDIDVQLAFAIGGGGGGSAVLAFKDGEWVIIAAAGGGGGAYQGAAGFCVASQKGQGGRATNAGGAGAGEYAGNGGGNGQGGDGGGLILNGDLSGGGGGAFSDGKGNASREGKAGYPDGGAGGTFGLNSTGSEGGWGFGGGGGGEEAGGGGGGYSGGGGGGAENNGGGGGSYVHPTYAIDPVITAGGAGGDTEHGDIDYQFKNVCSVNWTGTVQYNGYEFIENICRETDRGTIQMLFDYDDGNTCAPNLEWTIFQSGGDTENYVYLGDGRWSNVAVGFHLVQVINTDLDVVVASTEIQVRPRNHQPTAKCKNVTISLPSSKQITVPDDFIDDGSTGSSICDESISFSASKTTFKCTDVGQEQVVLTVTGSSGNSKNCTSTVTIVDNSIAFAACVPDGDYDLLGRESASITLVDIDAGSVRSTCTEEVLFYYPSTFTPQGPVTADNVGEGRLVGIRIIDETGVTLSRCQTTLTIIDSGTPVLNCKEEVTVTLDADGTAILDPTQILDEGSNIPPSWPYRVRDQEGSPISELSCEDDSELEVTLLVNEFTIHEMSCNTIIKLESSAGPVAICNDKTISLGEDGLAGIEIEEIGLGSYSNCSIFQLSEGTLSKTLFSCEDLGANIVTMTISDANGNTSNCEATVTVLDEEAPVAQCQNTTIQLDNNGGATLSVADIDNGSSDACGIASFALDVTTFSCEDVGSKIVKLTATDAAGNASSCNAMVSVEDNVAPIALCQDITIQLDNNGEASISTTDIDNGSNDACGITSLSLDVTTFSCEDVGSKIVKLTATDAAGNASSCNAMVSVEDNVAPIALCQDITIQLDNNGEASISTADIDNGSNDACGIADLALDQTSFNCDQAGNNTVTLTAIDNNGNSSICQATVVAVDEIIPTLTCPQDMTINTDPGECGAYVTLPKAAPTDNCSIKELVSRYRPLDSEGTPSGDWSDWIADHSGFFELGAYQIQWRATDLSDNVNFCSIQLTLVDEEAPEVICTDVTIDFNGETTLPIASSTILDQVTSFDACGSVSFVSQTLDQVSCENIGETIPVHVIGIDPNGNTSTCTAQVTVAGIPCGFEATDINCENGASASYDPVEDSYTLTANDCEGYPAGEFSTVMTELCGDGEVIAKVASLSGDGRAGVIMMESLTPDARFVSSMKDLTPRTRTEYRFATGGGIRFKSKNRSRVKWVRIVREGPKFKTYTSTNGSYWRKSHTIEYETFANCIQVGLIAYSKNANEPVTAIFDNVKVIGDSPNTLEQVDGIPELALQAIDEQESLTNSDIGLEVAPNPFAEQTQIEFTLPTASDVTLEIYNLHGQRVQNLESAQLGAGIHRYQWDGNSSKGESMPTGIYMIRLRADKKWITTKVSLINR